jgi:hypothetical protein
LKILNYQLAVQEGLRMDMRILGVDGDLEVVVVVVIMVVVNWEVPYFHIQTGHAAIVIVDKHVSFPFVHMHWLWKRRRIWDPGVGSLAD